MKKNTDSNIKFFDFVNLGAGGGFKHYSNLKNEISILYEEIYKEKIDSLGGKFDSIGSEGAFLDKVKNDITDAYAKGKISDQHYNLLNEKISEYKNNLEPVNKLSSFQKTTSKDKGSPIKSNK